MSETLAPVPITSAELASLKSLASIAGEMKAYLPRGTVRKETVAGIATLLDVIKRAEGK